MDGLTDILPHIAGLPWVATFIVIVLTLLLNKGVDKLIGWRKASFEERQYEDGQTKEGYRALIEELKNRIVKLETDFREVIGELKDSRAAHSKCEVQQAELRGKLETQSERMNAMQLKLEALERHEKVQVEHTKVINEAIKQIDPTAELPPPIEPIRK